MRFEQGSQPRLAVGHFLVVRRDRLREEAGQRARAQVAISDDHFPALGFRPPDKLGKRGGLAAAAAPKAYGADWRSLDFGRFTVAGHHDDPLLVGARPAHPVAGNSRRVLFRVTAVRQLNDSLSSSQSRRCLSPLQRETPSNCRPTSSFPSSSLPSASFVHLPAQLRHRIGRGDRGKRHQRGQGRGLVRPARRWRMPATSRLTRHQVCRTVSGSRKRRQGRPCRAVRTLPPALTSSAWTLLPGQRIRHGEPEASESGATCPRLSELLRLPSQGLRRLLPCMQARTSPLKIAWGKVWRATFSWIIVAYIFT